MKKPLLITTLALSLSLSGQTISPHAREGNAALKAKDYATALAAYQLSLRDNPSDDFVLYTAACAAARLGQSDLAFDFLDRAFPAGEEWIIGRTALALAKDADLVSLRNHPRWQPFIDTVEQRYAEVQAGPLAKVKVELLAIREKDQAGRQKLQEVEKAHGRQSSEMQKLWAEIAVADAENLPKIEAVLSTHGWLGPRQVGHKASSVLFLVIQHADLAVQQRYLPMMRAAAKEGKAQASSLALLEDRIALREGRHQIYGSQIGRDPDTGTHYVAPLDDPGNVDARRAAVGLSPLAEYVKRWNITWDVEAYNKQLPNLKNPFMSAKSVSKPQ